MNFTAIDFETANRKRTSACSIGLAKVRDGKVVDTYYSLLRPVPDEFEFQNIAVHGITPGMVAESPTLLEAWPVVSAFVGDDVLVAHSVQFEQSVINQYMDLHGQPLPEFDYLCTCYMSKVNYPNRKGYKLDDMCKDLLGKKVNHHHALEDAVACAELAVHHIGMFREQDVRALLQVLYTNPVKDKQDWKTKSGRKPTPEELDPGHPLFGKHVAITGGLDGMSREMALLLLNDCGAICQERVTQATNYLVVGDQDYQLTHFGAPSRKLRQATMMKELGKDIEIVTEKEFLFLLIGGED